MVTMASFFPGGGSSAWEAKVWQMLAEACASQADRNSMSYGAGEPFVDATDLALTSAVVESGYCRNTVTAAVAGSNVIPTLTNLTGDGWTVSAASSPTGYEVWRMFNKVTTPTDCWNPAGTYPFSAVMQAPSAQTIAAYTMLIPAGWNNSYTPTAWVLEGNNDGGSTWTTIDSQSSQNLTVGTKYTYTLSSSVTYTYFRLRITAGLNGSQAMVGELELLGVGTPAAVNAATITLAPVTISSATAGRIIFTGYNADAAAILDVGNSGSNKVEVYPMISGSAGSALAFTNESLGSNKWRFTSSDISIAGATSFGVRFKSFARSIAPNFRLYEALFVWR